MYRFRLSALAARLGALALGALLSSCGGYGSSANDYPPINLPNSIVTGDFNGDGKQDIALAATTSYANGAMPGYASVILQNAAGAASFASPTRYGVGNGPSAIAAASLTGSGIDLVVANYLDGSVSVLRSMGPASGQYQVATTVMSGGAPNDIAVGDLNGDGHPDLALADVNGNLIVLMQSASSPGTFAAPVALPTPYAVYAVAIGDVNGDGHNDVVLAGFDASGNHGTVSVFLQDPANPGSFLPRVDYAAGAGPTSVRIADIDQDGLMDLVVCNQGPGTDGSGAAGMSVLMQNPAAAGTFLAPVTYGGHSGATNVQVADLDGDGHPDVIVTSYGPSPTGSVTVFLQDPTRPGVFLTPTSYATAGGPISASIADLDGDGRPDIAVADGPGVVILLQNPAAAGTFAPPVVVGS